MAELLHHKIMDPEEKLKLECSLAQDLHDIAPNPNKDVDIHDSSITSNKNIPNPQSDTINIINFCIEEIIDAVQENSAIIVAVNEAISAVDEETKNEFLSDEDNSISENIKDKGDSLTVTNIHDTIIKSHSLIGEESKSSNDEKLEENITDDKTQCLEKSIDKQRINELNTNGKEFKSHECIIFSNDSEETKNKSVPVRLLSVSKNISCTDQDNKDKSNVNTNENKSETLQNKNTKMKKLKRNAGGGSRFRLGSLFGIGNSNINNDVNPKDSEVATNPRYSTLDLCDTSYSNLDFLERQKSSVSTEPFIQSHKYHKSTASLVRRSASKLSLSGVGGANAYSCSQARSQHVKNQHNSSYQTLVIPDVSNASLDTTPVLLAVRKRASSDSKPGLFSYGHSNSSNTDDSNYYSSNSSKNCSPCVYPKNKNLSSITNTKNTEYHKQHTSTTTTSSKLGFFKIFNKSLHALHHPQNTSQVDNRRENYKDVPNSVKVGYTTTKGVYSTLQNQKRGSRVHQVTTSNSPTSRRTRTLPVEVLSERPLYTSDLKQAEPITASVPVPRPVLPQKRISSNTSATFNAREHLMFMLRRRRKGGKFSPNSNHDYEDINVSKVNGNLGITNASTSEQTSSSMSSINSTNDRRRGNHRYQHSNVPIASNGHQLTIRPQVHHSHSVNGNSRHLPVHSSSSTNSVNSTTSSTERNSGVETEGSGGIESSVNGSNYDSGAFSRTSSPADEIEGPPGPPPPLASRFRKALSQSHSDILASSTSFRQNLSKLNPNHASTIALIEQMRSSLSASMSRLALEVEPLNAPALVMAAVNGGGTQQHHQHCCINDTESSNCWKIGSHVLGCEQRSDSINPSLVLACLNAASESSSLQQSFRGDSVDSGVVLQSPSRARCLARNSSNIGIFNGFIRSPNIGGNNNGVNDVSVTVGANTMLTISNNGDKMMASGLRRSRSGLPMLGTSGLMTIPLDKSNFHQIPGQHSSTYTSTLPSHGMKKASTTSKKRNKISTVYLQGNSPSKIADQTLRNTGCETLMKQLHQKSSGNTILKLKDGLERSDSLVTIMGATVCNSTASNTPEQMHCNCDEKVTVNGQHLHCPTTKDGCHPLANCEKIDTFSNPPNPPPVDYPEESVQYIPSSIDLIENTKERRPIRDDDQVFRFDASFHSALANDYQHYQPIFVDRSTNTSSRITPVSVTSNDHENNVVGDDYAINNNFSASNSEASQTQPNSLIII